MVAIIYIIVEVQKINVSIEIIIILAFQIISTSLFLVSAAVISLVEGTGVFLWTPLVLGFLV